MNATIDAIAERPERDEYDIYYHRYISLVPDGDITVTLARAFPQTRELLETVPLSRECWAYEPGKWNFREVVGHLTDMERVFAGRALWIARDPETALPSFEQNIWAPNSNARHRPLRELLYEWASVRAARPRDDAARRDGVWLEVQRAQPGVDDCRARAASSPAAARAIRARHLKRMRNED